MSKSIRHQYRYFLYPVLVLMVTLQAGAAQGPPGRLIISLGGSAIGMNPMNDSAIHELTTNFPGLYVKVSGESYRSTKKFTHVDLNMSFNNGIIENGTMRESRLCINYGFGRAYEMVKFSISPGLCYSSIGYQNNTLNKTITETRFAPSLGLQVDLIIVKSQYRYVALFMEGSAMIAKPSKWVQQLTFGINWQPGFRKDDRPAPKAY